MLPSPHRMTRGVEFSAAVRDGQRSKAATLILHQRLAPAGDEAAPARVGFVVSKAIGGSVVRHRVARRLRAILGERIALLPEGSSTVVRALPAASVASSRQLGSDVTVALERLARRPRG